MLEHPLGLLSHCFTPFVAQGFVRPGCTMLVLDLISRSRGKGPAGGAAEKLVGGMASHSASRLNAALEGLLGQTVLSENGRIVIQAVNQVGSFCYDPAL